MQALDGASSGSLWFYTAQECTAWLRAVSANISDLTLQKVSTETFHCPCFCSLIHEKNYDVLLLMMNPETVGNNIKQKNMHFFFNVTKL